MVATSDVPIVFSSCFFMLPWSTKVEARLCRYAPSLLLAIGSSCPPSGTVAMPCITPIRWYASFHWLKDTHSGVLLQAEPASVACEGWESYASGVPRGGVEHPRGGESELLRSATRWRKEKPARPLPARLTCCPRWLSSRCLFSRILLSWCWFAPAGRSALAANGRFAA